MPAKRLEPKPSFTSPPTHFEPCASRSSHKPGRTASSFENPRSLARQPIPGFPEKERDGTDAGAFALFSIFPPFTMEKP